MTEETNNPPNVEVLPGKRRWRRKLSNMSSVRIALAVILRKVESGEEPDLDKAKVLIYGYRELARLIEGADIEKKIEELKQLQVQNQLRLAR